MEIVQVLQDLNRNVGLTVIMVTHNQDLARHADRMFEMKDGQIYQIKGGSIVNDSNKLKSSEPSLRTK